ncbi:MAG: hypothetical protein MJY52_00640 [Bacteroidaceae bacterium]|nr:hypothetical protein [Bacteroidaceae bacterium]
MSEESSKLELPRCERSEGRSRDAERESKGCKAQGGRPKVNRITVQPYNRITV